jgi:hypothetical protein
MTAAPSHDSQDPAADQQMRRPDELEHWLTDLRVRLGQDPPDWLRPDGHTDDPTAGLSTMPTPTGNHIGWWTRTTTGSTDPSGSVRCDPPGPPAGRHRAAD